MIPNRPPEKPPLLKEIEAMDGLYWEDLGRQGLRIAQLKDSFRFGEEQVLLAHWAAGLIKPRRRLQSARGQKPLRTVDPGCGNGILTLLISALIPGSEGLGVELMERPFKLACANIYANKLSGRFRILRGDLRRYAQDGIPAEASPGSFDLVLGNSPYFLPGTGPSRDESTEGAREIAAAREERFVSLEEYMKCCGNWLAPGGQAAFLQRPERLRDCFREAAAAGLQVTRLRAIVPRPGRAPSAFLMAAKKDPAAGFVWERALIIRREDGRYTDETASFYPEESGASDRAGGLPAAEGDKADGGS